MLPFCQTSYGENGGKDLKPPAILLCFQGVLCVCVCVCVYMYSILSTTTSSSSDDYRLTAAMSLLKLLVSRGVLAATSPKEDTGLTPLPPLPPSPPQPKKLPLLLPKTPASRGQLLGGQNPGKSPDQSRAAEGLEGVGECVREHPLQLAMKACQAYLDSHEHKDIEGNHHHCVSYSGPAPCVGVVMLCSQHMRIHTHTECALTLNVHSH